MSVVVVVICASCAGYGRVFKSLLSICKVFSFKKIFPAPQYGFTIFLAVILSDLIKLSLTFKTKT